MRYRSILDFVGARPMQEYFQPVNDVGGGVTGYPASSYTGPGGAPNFMPAGVIIVGYDDYFGSVEFMYGQASATINAWAPCLITPAVVSGRWQFQMAPVTNTANLGRPLAVAIQQMSANQFGWFAVGGLVPVASGASVAANTLLGITAAGLLGADSAGKEVLNAVSIAPATTTVTKNCLVTAGSPTIRITGNNDIFGLFVGAAVSGTGIPANAVVQTIDPDGRTFTISTGPGVAGSAVNATLSGGVTLTFTYNDGTNFYNLVHLNRPFAQGRIT